MCTSFAVNIAERNAGKHNPCVCPWWITHCFLIFLYCKIKHKYPYFSNFSQKMPARSKCPKKTVSRCISSKQCGLRMYKGNRVCRKVKRGKSKCARMNQEKCDRTPGCSRYKSRLGHLYCRKNRGRKGRTQRKRRILSRYNHPVRYRHEGADICPV